ncbi:variable large family protein [Borrelia sp. HM]|uniref:variable large family protein n=1 Tax=Borrelia sp. HM TaxID=1882662 RepID=UPI001C79A692|nr:variable large family protein [Borrelia sp. HM]BCR21442.1 Variable large protein 7 [Borrelia sp. HM]
MAVEKRLGEIGKSAENAFYSFLNFISDTLGLRVTAETKKSEVGEHFTTLGTKLGEASEELEKVAVKAATDGDKDSLLNKSIREAVEAAKTTLNTLKTHLEDLKGIGNDGEKVGVAANNGSDKEGTGADGEELNKVLKAFKGIVDEAGKVDVVVKPVVGTSTLNNGTDNITTRAKILATNSGGNKPTNTDPAKAAAILEAVSGKAMLASIIASKENDPQIAGSGADGNTTAMSFARGNSVTTAAQNSAKVEEAVAGGIALRSLVKSGTLAKGAADNATGGGKEVQGVGITAVNKLLGAVEDIIKKTVKNVLDKARDSKTASQQ